MGRLSRSRGLWCIAETTLLTVFLAVVGPAEAAFPGRDGLLAVQPLKSSGIVLVKANGNGERRVCQAGSGQLGNSCSSLGVPLKPVWSPDGRSLVVSRAA